MSRLYSKEILYQIVSNIGDSSPKLWLLTRPEWLSNLCPGTKQHTYKRRDFQIGHRPPPHGFTIFPTLIYTSSQLAQEIAPCPLLAEKAWTPSSLVTHTHIINWPHPHTSVPPYLLSQRSLTFILLSFKISLIISLTSVTYISLTPSPQTTDIFGFLIPRLIPSY